jgi:hypothetical protein
MDEFQDAVLDDAWYELEGAYEVYGIGRCRFVLVHCRAAILMGLILLARSKGSYVPGMGVETLGRMLGMSESMLVSLLTIESDGRYRSILKGNAGDQEHAAAMLSRTLEIFEWMKGEMPPC